MNRFPEALNNHAPGGNPPCECGHEYEDHEFLQATVYSYEGEPVGTEEETICFGDGPDCNCTEYREFDEYAAAEEASLRRAEMRGEWRT